VSSSSADSRGSEPRYITGASRVFVPAAVAAFALAALTGSALAATPSVTDFPTLERTLSIAAGPDGKLWYTEDDATIGRITTSGSSVETTVPGIGATATLGGIVAGADGNLWFTVPGGDKISLINTSGGGVQHFDSPDPGISAPLEITAGPDGNLWATEFLGNRIDKVTPGPGGGIQSFGVGITGGANLRGIVAGSDGNLWFTEAGLNRIGRITTAGSVLNEYSTGIGAGAGLSAITAGPDGNLWFTENGLDRIGRITPAGLVTEFSAGISAGAGPSGIVAGPDGNLWFTENDLNRVGRITPSGSVTEFTAGFTGDPNPSVITAGPDGNLWLIYGDDDTDSDNNVAMVSRLNTGEDPPAFRNPSPIALPASGTSGPAGPYPSQIAVSGLQGTITDVDVRLTGISHEFVTDLDFLLVGPQGQTAVLVSDMGSDDPDPNGITLRIDDEAPYTLPLTSPVVSGPYRPFDKNDGADLYPAPAPAGPYGSQLAAFDGTDPNGAWKLFARDDASTDAGNLFGGWGLDIQTTGPPTPEPTPPGGTIDSRVELSLSAKPKQKLKKLAVEAGCSGEACTVDAGGTAAAKPKKPGKAALKNKKFTLRPASGSAPAGGTVKLPLRVKGKKKAKALAKLLKKKAKGSATVTVTATDSAGNSQTETAAIRLKR
jgi:streptogramin lyase/subtilisin-like proprotein convertase family protein